MQRDREQRRGDFPERGAPGAQRPPMPGARGQTRGAPPELPALPGRAGASPGTCGADSSGAGGQLTSWPPPLGGGCPRWVPLPPLKALPPPPPPPYPLWRKCHSFSASDLLQSLRVVARSWAAVPGARTRPCPAPPSAARCSGPAGSRAASLVTVPRAQRAVLSLSLAPPLARVAAACLRLGSSLPCS